MVSGQLNAVVAYLRKMTTIPDASEGTDGQLLERFTAQHDEAAFRTLVERHGPLVWSVCRRVLRQTPDAEDAFQATFLVLVRKAGSIRKRASVRSWLYGVARRVAVRARTNAGRRQTTDLHKLDVPQAVDPAREVAEREWHGIVDEEIQRLPETQRQPLILCYLEGKTNDEAAQELGCPRGTIATRLAHARARLRQRLTRRGVVLPAAALTVELSRHVASAAPAPIVEVLVKAALARVADTAAVVSPQVAALTEGTLKAMFMSKLKLLAAILLVLGVLGTGAALFAFHGQPAEPAEPGRDEKPKPLPVVKQDKGDLPGPREKQDVPSQREGVLLVVGTDIKEGENVPAERIVTVKIHGEVKKYRRLQVGDKVEEGQLLARVDDRLARDEVAIRKAKLAAAEADYVAATKTRDEAQERRMTLLRLQRAVEGSAVSAEDVRAAKSTWERYKSEADSKSAALEVAKLELKQSQTLLEMYEIRSSIRGVIKAIHKQRGEAIRSLETVILVEGVKE